MHELHLTAALRSYDPSAPGRVRHGVCQRHLQSGTQSLVTQGAGVLAGGVRWGCSPCKLTWRSCLGGQILMDLMPSTETLTTEHIKSHLQKYRLHHNRYSALTIALSPVRGFGSTVTDLQAPPQVEGRVPVVLQHAPEDLVPRLLRAAGLGEGLGSRRGGGGGDGAAGPGGDVGKNGQPPHHPHIKNRCVGFVDALGVRLKGFQGWNGSPPCRTNGAPTSSTCHSLARRGPQAHA